MPLVSRKLVEIDVVATTAPLALVARSALDRLVMAKLVVVALVVVAFPASIFTNRLVDEAKTPLCAQIGVAVAAVATAKFESVANG